MPMRIDLKGQRFGRLIALEFISGKWLCKCDCGNTTLVTASNLKQNNTKSCGCLHKEITSKMKYQDLTGQKFGRLTVVEDIKERRNGSVVWKCKCDCGNEAEIRTGDLTSGSTQSCGCLSDEKRRERIKEASIKQQEIYAKEVWVEGTHLKNLQMKVHKNNISGVKGVTWDKNRNKWSANICLKYKQIHLGRFDELEDAIRARKEAEKKYFQPILEKYEKR